MVDYRLDQTVTATTTGPDWVVISVSVAEAADGGWYSSLTNGARATFLAETIRQVKLALGCSRILAVAPGGFFLLPSWDLTAVSNLCDSLAQNLPDGCEAIVGIDESLRPVPGLDGWSTSQVQSMVHVDCQSFRGPVTKMSPAKLKDRHKRTIGYEPLREASTNATYSDRIVDTLLGPTFLAVCQDIFSVAHPPPDYRRRTASSWNPPSREQLVAAQPVHPEQVPALIANSIHRFHRSPGYFPQYAGDAADHSQAPVVSAARYVGFLNSRWNAARRPADGDRGLSATWHFEAVRNRGRCKDWIWVQAYDWQTLSSDLGNGNV